MVKIFSKENKKSRAEPALEYLYLVLQKLVLSNPLKMSPILLLHFQPEKTMQGATSLPFSSTLPTPHHPLFPNSGTRLSHALFPSFPLQLPFKPPPIYLHATVSPLRITGTLLLSLYICFHCE